MDFEALRSSSWKNKEFKEMKNSKKNNRISWKSSSPFPSFDALGTPLRIPKPQNTKKNVIVEGVPPEMQLKMKYFWRILMSWRILLIFGAVVT